jgi:hypothetical protein
MTREQLNKCKDRLRQYERRDEDKVKTDKAKNDFESVIYQMRDWINEDSNKPFIPSDEIDGISIKLSDDEDWLMDEGDKASYLEYHKRFNSIN